MTGKLRQINLPSPEATCRFAQALAPALGAGDVLLLAGDVGAGKTHFARCLIRALLPAPEEVPSPTYTLVQTYPSCRGVDIWHADLYRLGGSAEIEELGLAEAFAEATCLVEWPDRLGAMAPSTALRLQLDATDGGRARRLTLQWTDPRWDRRIAELTQDA